MHAICLVQGDYRQPWGRTDGSLNTGTWLRKRVSRAVGSRCSRPQTFLALLQETVLGEFSSLQALPTHTEKEGKHGLRCDGVTELHSCLSWRPWKEKKNDMKAREDAELPIVGTKSSGGTVAGSRAREAKHQEHWLYHGMGSQRG